MIENTILCVKWGDKYSREYVEKLKQQCEDNCSVPFNFYCLTDKKEKDYDVFVMDYRTRSPLIAALSEVVLMYQA